MSRLYLQIQTILVLNCLCFFFLMCCQLKNESHYEAETGRSPGEREGM